MTKREGLNKRKKGVITKQGKLPQKKRNDNGRRHKRKFFDPHTSKSPEEVEKIRLAVSNAVQNKDLFSDYLKGGPTMSVENLKSKGVAFKFKGVEIKGNRNSEIKIIPSNSPNLCNEIFNEFYKNLADVIVFDSALPLIANKNFIDLIVENKIPFTSMSDSPFAEAYSDTLNYLSTKLDKKAGDKKAGKRMKNTADEFAKKIGPKLDELEAQGHKTLLSKATQLNNFGIKTMRGKEWTKTTIKNTYERWQKLKQEKNTGFSSKKPKPE